jgi:N-acetylneuraminic acid mutarotase
MDAVAIALANGLRTDYTQDSWGSSAAYMPDVAGEAAAAAINGKGYVFGGFRGANTLDRNWEYDPATNTWTTKANMPTARRKPTAFTINNIAYVVGSSDRDTSAVTGINEAYNPATNTWASKAGMPTARGYATPFVINGKGYIVGGSISASSLTNATEEYDPTTNSWATKTVVPQSPDGCGFVLKSKGYVVTTPGNTYEYDPATNAWVTKQPRPVNLAGAIGFADGIYGYSLCGGASGTGNQVYQYDSVKNVWYSNKFATMTQAIGYSPSFALNGAAYLCGGTGLQGDIAVYKYTPEKISILGLPALKAWIAAQ